MNMINDNNDELINQLIQICGAENIISDPQIKAAYLADWRKRYIGNALAVVLPTSSEQIQALVKLCQQKQIAITPQGGNTSTCGGATPLSNYPKLQIIINLQRMNKIIELNPDNFSLTVEAGCTLQQIHDYLAPYQLAFPLTLASQGSCQIGANLATNAGGTQVLKYGMIRDLTLGIEAVLPSGEILNALNNVRKNNSYLDLKQLLIGSEGTLGIITRACLKLSPKVANYCTLLIGAKNLNQAHQLLQLLRHHYSNAVCAFEIISNASWQIYQQIFPTPNLQLNEAWLILAELEINHDFELSNLVGRLESLSINPDACIITESDNKRKALWQMREQIPLAEKQFGYAAKHDISLPLNKIEEFISINQAKLKQIEPKGYFSIFGHLGDGNLHYNFGLMNASKEQIISLEKLVNPVVYQDVIALGGSISAEHGIGQTKKHWLKQFQNQTSYNLMLEIKKLLDPNNLFNPGKVL